MSDFEELDSLPPVRENVTAAKSYRKYQMTVSTDTFLKLEIQAAKRGTTSYKLAATIINMFVNGKLKVIEESAANGSKNESAGEGN